MTTRARPQPGYYRDLSNLTTADYYPRPAAGNAGLSVKGEELPEGIFAVSRLVTYRERSKVYERAAVLAKYLIYFM